MGKLATHVLDTSNGTSASNMSIDLYKLAGDNRQHIGTYRTNCDGRVDQPFLDVKSIEKSCYELIFQVEEYFASKGTASPFLKEVVIRFHIHAPDHA